MRISIFPLQGAILYPGLQLPLHIFEPRYRAMVKDALARDRRIGMIQPQQAIEGAPLYTVGCLGKIGEVEALDDGRFNLVLEGEARFRIIRELDTATPFRQIEGELFDEEEYPALSPVERAGFEREARRFANAQGLQPMGGNEWAVTAASGTAQIDAPGSGRFGFIQGGALEESNVDLTGELVNMIVAQRSYQANAQTIKTEDQVLQTLVNLR